MLSNRQAIKPSVLCKIEAFVRLKLHLVRESANVSAGMMKSLNYYVNNFRSNTAVTKWIDQKLLNHAPVFCPISVINLGNMQIRMNIWLV